ncbi:hypothetical protein Tco_1051238 [Tanacetum coccineum]
MAARRNQERIKSILLLAIPDEYLLKFHNVPDAKSLWAAIKSRFGGNKESKKMQKNVLKHQFENFVTTSNETLDKSYDRFQKLTSQLEIHGAYVSKEDINKKVYEDELKRSLGSNSASQNLAFLSFENTNKVREEIWTSKKNDMFLLISQRLSATTVKEKGILLKNVDLEEVKEEDLMGDRSSAQTTNLPLRHWCFQEGQGGYDVEQ